MSDYGIERVRNRDGIIVAGHRGMKKLYPENTLLSMREALLSGVDMIETDLNLTKDKEIVIIHDNTVDRTTNGSGAVRDMTLEQIRKLDAGIKFGKAFQGLHVPTLREFCEFTAPWTELLYNIEIKERTFETVDITMSILEEFGLIGRCVFTCFDAGILGYMADRYGVKTQGFPKEYMDNFVDGPEGTYSKMFAVGIAMSSSRKGVRLLTPEIVKEFGDMGIEPWCYCPDTPEMVEAAIACGARLVTSNNPLHALRIFRERGLHPKSIKQPEKREIE